MRPGARLPGIAVVTNPRSRQNRRDPAIAGQLAYVLGERGQLAQPTNREELVDAARRFRDHGIDVLAINGGDGTAHVVLTAMVQAYGSDPLPPIALLRGGTMNTVASGIGVKGSPAALLGALVARYHAGEPLGEVERNLLCVPGPVPQYGFLFGNGLIANFLEAYYAGSEPSPQKAAWILARAVASALVGGALFRRLMRPIELEVEVDGVAWAPASYLCVGAGTVDDIGLRFRPFHLAPTHPNHVHAVAFGCSPFALIGQLGNIWLARPTSAPGIRSVLARRMVLRGNMPIPYMIDGDFHTGMQTLTIEVGPRVRLLVP
ncbi:MAG: diacylglycerol kinase family protein [Pseudomonadota bacterium]|nr:diacylglycerol kinase family protein [Pseudomonadota bacterium]